MTAVEWFAKQVLEYKSPTNINGTDYILIPTNKIEFLQEQAKEMEKEQIRDAFNSGMNNSVDYFIPFLEPNDESENYYNETFKSE